MKLSQGVEWGLHCVALLAEVEPGTTLRREVLAGHYDLPEAYLAKHLQALTRAGVLRATPGPKGGYRLGRPADEITVLDVVDAIEGTADPFECQEIRLRSPVKFKPEECRRPCAVSTVMRQAHHAYRAHLRSVTIADLVKQVPDEVRDRIVKALTTTPERT